jgi:hypothetical protein
MNITNKAGQMFGVTNILFIAVIMIVGFCMVGPIAQELKNVVCISNESIVGDASLLFGSPEGSTDSFGGAGANRFGGYDGKVTHNSFLDAVASTSMVKTDKSILNPNCAQLSSGVLFMIDNFTVIFVIFNLIFGLIVFRTVFTRNVGDL